MKMRCMITMLVSAIVVSLPQLAAASSPSFLLIDDFSSGEYKVMLRKEGETGTQLQPGRMIGGHRRTLFTIQPNDFLQPATVEILPQSSILVVGTGIGTGHRLELLYGIERPLNLNLGSFAKFRTQFHSYSAYVSFIIQVWTKKNPSEPVQCSTGLFHGPSRCIDFRFNRFRGPSTDFESVDMIHVILQAGSTEFGAHDYGIRWIKAVPDGTSESCYEPPDCV